MNCKKYNSGCFLCAYNVNVQDKIHRKHWNWNKRDRIVDNNLFNYRNFIEILLSIPNACSFKFNSCFSALIFVKLFELSNTTSYMQLMGHVLTQTQFEELYSSWKVRWAPNVFVSPSHLLHSHKIERSLHPQPEAAIHRSTGLMPSQNTHISHTNKIYIVDSLYYTRSDHAILPLVLCMCVHNIVQRVSVYASMYGNVNSWMECMKFEISATFQNEIG